VLDIALSLAPIFLLILIGHAMKRGRFVPDTFWAPAEKLTYFVTFPALLVANLAGADLAGLAWPAIALSLGGATLGVAGLALALRRWVGGTAAAFTSAFQGAIRPNTYIGLAGAAALFGDAGVTLTAVCIAIVVPLVNVLAVACLSVFVPAHGGASLKATLVGIARNPLILACVIGIALNVMGLGLPPVAGPLLKILGAAALPVGLLAVGAGLALDALRGAGRPLVTACVLKLGVLPLTAAVILVGLSTAGMKVNAAAFGIAMLYAALPCSASSYVLARQMGGDAPLMANIITLQTLLAAGTIPVVLMALALAGLTPLP